MLSTWVKHNPTKGFDITANLVAHTPGETRYMGEEAFSVSRRAVITTLCVSGLVAACSRPTQTVEREKAQAAAVKAQALAHGSMGDWQQMVGSVFQATGGYALGLVGVRPLQSEGARPANVSRSSAFLAVFDVLGGQTMAGDLIYSMSTSRLGPLDVFLTAAPTPEFPSRMHAVFN